MADLEPYIRNEQLLVSSSVAPAANTALTHRMLVVPTWAQLVAVFVRYSANVTVNVDITLDSHLGTDFDLRLVRIPLVDDQHAWWQPEKDLRLAPGDQIQVDAPAAAGATARAYVYLDPGRVRFDGLESLLEPWLLKMR